MRSIEIGDLVRCIEPEALTGLMPQEYEVQGFGSSPNFLMLRGFGGSWRANRFELAADS